MKLKLTKWCEYTGKKYRRALRDFEAGNLEHAFKDKNGRIWVELNLTILYSYGDLGIDELVKNNHHDFFFYDDGDYSAIGDALAKSNMKTFKVKGWKYICDSKKELIRLLLEARDIELIIL